MDDEERDLGETIREILFGAFEFTAAYLAAAVIQLIFFNGTKYNEGVIRLLIAVIIYLCGYLVVQDIKKRRLQDKNAMRVAAVEARLPAIRARMTEAEGINELDFCYLVVATSFFVPVNEYGEEEAPMPSFYEPRVLSDIDAFKKKFGRYPLLSFTRDWILMMLAEMAEYTGEKELDVTLDEVIAAVSTEAKQIAALDEQWRRMLSMVIPEYCKAAQSIVYKRKERR